MNHFDVIYYINLDERPDRKELFLQECQKYDIDMNKVKRIPAIKHDIPYIGCSKSHLKCLQDFEANNYQNCVIFEDDFVFKESKELTKFMLDKFFNSYIVWDVVMLSAFDRQVEPSYLPGLHRAIEVQTASGYAVNRPFLATLKENFEKGIQLLEECDEGQYCVDQYWKRLQPQHNWYVFSPKLGYQRDNYSNIENKMVSYRDKYDTKLPYNYKYILGVLSCHKNLPQAQQQYEKYLKDIRKYPIIYIKFIGNPDQKEPWLYNEKENLLTICCEDDYLNLPNKVYLFLVISKQLFPNMCGVFKTDEDIFINLPNLYQLLENNKHIPYYGRYINGNSYYSNYLTSKSYVTDIYPEFKDIPIKVEQGAYCSGGGYYINKDCVKIIIETKDDYFKKFPKNHYMEHLTTTYEYLSKNTVKENTYFDNLHVFEDKTIGVVLHKHNITPQDKRTELIRAVQWDGM